MGKRLVARFPHKLEDNLPGTGAIIEIDEDYLLILPQRQPLVDQGDNQRRTEE